MRITPALPNFLIVGAPKAGTTSLYAYLDQHPQIYMSPVKETNYFASEFRLENFSEEAHGSIARETAELKRYLQGDMREKRFGGLITDWGDYLKLFRNVTNEVAIGEASPCYLWSQTAARNIAARIPEARIIINLRNPVDRAYSQYLHMVTAGVTRCSFRELIQAGARATTRRFGALWPFLEFGLYFEQVQRYMSYFPHSQIHISFYEDFERRPEQLVFSLLAFLRVDLHHALDVSRHHLEAQVPRLATATYLLKKWRLWPYVRGLAPHQLGLRLRSMLVRSRTSLTIDVADRAFLADYYREDVEKLAALLSRDLDGWLAVHDRESREHLTFSS